MQYGRQPVGYAIGDFGVLKQRNDDAEETEDTSGGDETAGVESAGAGFAVVFFLGGGFDEDAEKSADKHGCRSAERQVGAGGKGERADTENFHCDYQRYAHQNQA